MNMILEFNCASTPPDTPRCVLVHFVFDPHHRPEWGFDLASFEDGQWLLWWDNTELDYAPIFWADVNRPDVPPETYWEAAQGGK